MTADKQPAPRGSIHVDISDIGQDIKLDGAVNTADLFIAAGYLTRTANQLADAATMRAAERDDKAGLQVVRAMPDALRGN